MGVKKPSEKDALRTGFSTGTAAAAATKGAMLEFLGLPCPETVEISLPVGGTLLIPLKEHSRRNGSGQCLVIKDAGDDPDVTHGAEIGVKIREVAKKRHQIRILGGRGVGQVTKPGLPIRVGEPAINPTPRQMIRRALKEIFRRTCVQMPPGIEVEVFVPRGEELARKTLNPRLGILGGISILGTTGLVKPFSHEAYKATVSAGLSVARAMGHRQVVLSTGGKSEGYARKEFPAFPEEVFIQMGDYVQFSLQRANRVGFALVVVAAFFGKSLKIAQGLGHTHASRGPINFEMVGKWTFECTGDSLLADAITRANTAREALEILTANRGWNVVERVGFRMVEVLRRFAGPGPEVVALMFDFSGILLWRGISQGKSV